jgi:hypothetical protein
MAKKSYAAMATRLFTAIVVMMGMVMVSCTDSNSQFEQDKRGITQDPSADPSREISGLDSIYLCNVNGNRFDHTMSLNLTIKVKGNDTPETTLKSGEVKSSAVLSLDKETIRVDENAEKPYQVGETSYNPDSTKAIITVSDSRILTLDFKSGEKSLEWLNVEYGKVYDKLVSARFLYPVYEKPLTRAGEVVPTKYIKNTWTTKYLVEVVTNHYWYGNKKGTDIDTLVVVGTTLEMADNGTTNTKTGTGVKVISETQQKDSVVVKKSWDDGHSETMVFNTILNRWLKNIKRREIIVPDFNNQNASSSFSTIPKVEEKLVREEPNFKIYGREVTISKMVSVAGHTEEISYTYYQERADFNYKDVLDSFGYVDWQIGNYADDFKSEPISSKSGYDQLSYKNEIKTYYLDYIQMANEEIDWFKKSVTIIDYDVVNALRHDYTTYTLVSLDKVAIYSDGTSKKVGSYSAEMPINVNPLTNWVINTDVFGSYVSNDFSGSQTSKSAKTAEKFFSYNQYGYTYANTVSGQTNKLAASVPNDIVFDDGDVRYTFKNSDLKVNKVKDATAEAGDTDEMTTYKYTCTAGVTFGDSSQDVTLPGTINVTKDNGPHIHGKVKAVYFTTTPNESRSFYKSVCVLEFEDGFRSVGMTENGANEFNFNMSSYKYVNSAVYTGGNWIPAIAEDNTGAKCMIWKDENGTPKRTLDFITATRDSWNNGHNTVWDGRRSYTISKSGYSVTLRLSGTKDQTLKF